MSIATEQELSERWSDLRREVEKRDEAVFPRGLLWLLLLVAALLLTGTIVPLLALGAPSNSRQGLALLPFTVVVLAFGVVVYKRARSAFTTWTSTPIWDSVRYQVEEERMQEEGWEQQLEWEQEERRKQREARDSEPPPAEST